VITPELLSSTKLHEGLRLRAYQDSVEVWTIGYGTNLQTLTISEDLATEWLYEKLRQAEVSAQSYGWYVNLNQARRDAIIEMVYNLGLTRFDKFKNLQKALGKQDWAAARLEMLNSKWAEQVGERAKRLAEQIFTGTYWKS
jgi:lysozyme